MKFLIDEKLVQSIINYLATKPFNEVYQMIIELQKIQQSASNDKTSGNQS